MLSIVDDNRDNPDSTSALALPFGVAPDIEDSSTTAPASSAVASCTWGGIPPFPRSEEGMRPSLESNYDIAARSYLNEHTLNKRLFALLCSILFVSRG